MGYGDLTLHNCGCCLHSLCAVVVSISGAEPGGNGDMFTSRKERWM